RTGARENDASHRFVRIRGPDFIQKGLRQRGVERVALFRAIQRQDPDRAAVLHEKVRRRSPISGNRGLSLIFIHSVASLWRACSSSATRRRITSAAGRISSTRPALWPASTLPHSTSPSRAACFRLESLSRADSSSGEAPARSAVSYFREKAFFRSRMGCAPRPTSVVSPTSASSTARL